MINSPQAPPNRPGLRLARILTSTLICFALLDGIGRLAPIAWLKVLPELEASRRPGFLHPFIPNLSLREANWIGETAVTGNLPAEESRGSVSFTTDELGFRLTPNVLSQPKIDFILTGGASFAYGGGLSDNETFPAILTSEHQLTTYNAGRFFRDPPHFIYTARLIESLKAKQPRAVIYLYWENIKPQPEPALLDPEPWSTDKPGRAVLGAARYSELRENVQYWKRYATALTSISPVEVLSTRFFKTLSSGPLPNRYADSVVSRNLPDGRRILFLDTEVQRVIEPPSDVTLRRQADFFSQYGARLKALNLELYVILLPNKYSLYGEFAGGGKVAIPYLNRMEQELRHRGLKVLNGLTVFKAKAAEDVRSQEMFFFRDDHHWSPKGVRRIAAAFDEFVRGQGLKQGEGANAVQ